MLVTFRASSPEDAHSRPLRLRNLAAMAWIFELAAEFGPQGASAAEAFARHFHGLRWTFDEPGWPETLVTAGPQQGEGGDWWAIACPSGVHHSGSPMNEDDARRMTAIGLRLYERLKSAPNFRFAAVGAEVFDFRAAHELPDILLQPGLHGLVLSEPLWTEFGQPSLYVPFAPGYLWRPYRGETFVDNPLRCRVWGHR